MTVVKSKRSLAECEYVNQAHIVLRKTREIMKLWPKHNSKVDVEPAIQAAHELMRLSVHANTIFAETPAEHEEKLRCLEKAYGLLNYLVMMCADWKEDNQKSASKKKNRKLPKSKRQAQYIIEEREAKARTAKKQAKCEAACKKTTKAHFEKPQKMCPIDPKKFETFAGAAVHAIGVFSGAVKRQRREYINSRIEYGMPVPERKIPAKMKDKVAQAESTNAMSKSNTVANPKPTD